MRQLKRVFLLLICMGIISFLPNLVWAKVTGPCANCHSMHNSQGGQTIEGGEGGPYRHLTKGNCIGCHTGTNVGEGTSDGATPFVMSDVALDEMTYLSATLAGGNFYWVAQAGGDAKGHNVWNLSAQDDNITVGEGAPGILPTSPQYGCANTCHFTLADKQTTLPAFGSGCEGCHLRVAHHKGGSSTVYADDEDGWFRFCSGHITGDGHGVIGLEDDDWQYQPTSTEHNEYYGIDAQKILPTYNTMGTIGDTMTAYCCGCHSNFHTQADAGSTWIRHPSDAVIPDEGEYAAYTTYNPIAPVARDTVPTSVSSVVTPGDDMVMCLSCHRAHGSPYDDMLRWDYSEGTLAGGGGTADGTGCFVCHTTKDDS